MEVVDRPGVDLDLPSDFQPLLVIWPEELKGLVDLQTLPPVLANVELCNILQNYVFLPDGSIAAFQIK